MYHQKRMLLWLLEELSPSLSCVIAQLADMVATRAEASKNYGVVLVPEGLIECVPEVRITPPVPRDS